MEESILNSIKKLLGISSNNKDFDTDIIIHINTVITILNQMGVGKSGFFIEDDVAEWSDFIEEEKYSAVKSYIYLKVKLLFDPPLNSSIITAIQESIKELEWRLNFNYELEEV